MLNWIVFNRTDYLHEMDLALNNLQRLITHKTQQTKPNQTNVYIYIYIYMGIFIESLYFGFL